MSLLFFSSQVEEVTDAEEQHAPRIPGYKQAARALHALVCVISAEAAPPPESAPHGHVHCTQRAPHGLDAADHAATVCSLHAPHVQFKLGNTYRQAGVLLQNGALHGCQQLGHAVQVDAHAAQGVHLHGELAVAILEGW